MSGQKLRDSLGFVAALGLGLVFSALARAEVGLPSVSDQGRLIQVFIQNVDGGPSFGWRLPEDVAAFTRTNWTKYIVGRGQACALLAEAILIVDQLAVGRFWAWHYSAHPGYSAPGAPACASGAYLEIDLGRSLQGGTRDPQAWMQELLRILGPRPAQGSRK